MKSNYSLGLENGVDDDRLDAVISLLSIGLCPNVAVHTEGRKVLVDGKGALLHKSSANCPYSNKGVKFPYPTFVFGEKVRTRAVNARQTTCVTPAQLCLTSPNVSIKASCQKLKFLSRSNKTNKFLCSTFFESPILGRSGYDRRHYSAENITT